MLQLRIEFTQKPSKNEHTHVMRRHQVPLEALGA
jgi:hypothetical protein